MPALAKLDPDLLREHHVLVGADNAFQQRARLLQALWREKLGLPVGLHRGAPLGSLVDLEHGKRTLANFLTETIRDVVRHDVLGPGRDPDALINENRLFANLLSSQPLCFNLFGEFEGAFVFLYPEANAARATAVGAYRGQLRGSETFTSWTLESFIATLPWRGRAVGSVARGAVPGLSIAFRCSHPLIPHGFSIPSRPQMDRPSARRARRSSRPKPARPPVSQRKLFRVQGFYRPPAEMELQADRFLGPDWEDVLDADLITIVIGMKRRDGAEVIGRSGAVLKESVLAAGRLVQQYAAAYGIPEEKLRDHGVSEHLGNILEARGGPPVGMPLVATTVSALPNPDRSARDRDERRGFDQGQVSAAGGVPQEVVAACKRGQTSRSCRMRLSPPVAMETTFTETTGAHAPACAPRERDTEGR